MKPWIPRDPGEQFDRKMASIELDNAQAGHALPFEQGVPAFGPVSREKGELEFRRLTALADAIRQQGWRRHNGRDGDPEAVVLRCGRKKALSIVKGNHRVAVAAALGFQELSVRIFMRRVQVIDVEKTASWHLVKRGYLTEEGARKLCLRLVDGEVPQGCQPFSGSAR